MAVASQIDPLQWIPTFTATVKPSDRVEWMGQVAWMISRRSAEAVESLWQRWMRDYWQGHIDSIPVQLTGEEASAMALWAVFLTDSIEEGVRLSLAHPGALGEHGDLLRHLHGDRLDRAPAPYARLLAHLMRETRPPFWACHYLPAIVARLRDQADPPDVTAIIEEALRLGCLEATQW